MRKCKNNNINRSLEEVDYAILETSGKLSVFRKDSKTSGQYPLPLILDGAIDEDNLKRIKKDKTPAV